MRRAEPVPGRSVHRTEPWLREAAVPLVLVGNTVWRIKRRPVWNTMATAMPPLFVADGQGLAPKRVRLKLPSVHEEPDIRAMPPLRTAPGTEVAWDRTPFVPGTTPPFGRALRWPEGEAGKRWNLLNLKAPALHE